jgi:hypothetical protein
MVDDGVSQILVLKHMSPRNELLIDPKFRDLVRKKIPILTEADGEALTLRESSSRTGTTFDRSLTRSAVRRSREFGRLKRP